jgi:hypothetical protein
MVDQVSEEGFDAYSADQIADLSTGVLAELKRIVDAEVQKRIEDCKMLLPVPKKRASRKKSK